MENIIYLDNNSTTLLHPQVQEVMNYYMSKQPYNPSSIHKLGREARKLIDESKKIIAQSLNIDLQKYHIIFTSSGTEANNWLIKCLDYNKLLCGATEHASILKVKEKYEIIKVDENGIILLNDLQNKISNHSLVSIMIANNETGVIQDLTEAMNIAKAHKCFTHSDLIQAIGKITIDFEQLDLDFATISSHKIGGPIGTGALIVKRSTPLKPLIAGGGQNQGLRAGTENVVGIIAMAEAIKIATNNLKEYNLQTLKLRNYLEHKIYNLIDGVHVAAKNVERLSNTSYIISPTIKSENQLIQFDLANIALSSASACSSGKITGSHTLQAMGYSTEESNRAIRISTGSNNNLEDINKFLQIYCQIHHKTFKQELVS